MGENISLVFENRDTVIFQIQEMLRAERITDLDKIREEITVYNELIPNPGELSATLFHRNRRSDPFARRAAEISRH